MMVDYAAIPHIVFASPKCSGQLIMTRFTSGLYAGMFVAVLAIGAAFTSASAAPSLSEADDRAIKEAIASCKAEIKAKKIRFPGSRTYLRNCVTETIRANSARR